MVDKDCERFGQAGSAAKARNGPAKWPATPRPKAKVRSIRLRARCKTPWVERKTRFATTN